VNEGSAGRTPAGKCLALRVGPETAGLREVPWREVITQRLLVTKDSNRR